MTKPLSFSRLPLRAYACFIGGFIELRTIRKTPGASKLVAKLWFPKAPVEVRRVTIK